MTIDLAELDEFVQNVEVLLEQAQRVKELKKQEQKEDEKVPF